MSQNQIEVIENLENSRLHKLNLMNNKIKILTGLDNLSSLLHLNLSKNYIANLKGLENLINLRYLYLSSNLISRAKQVSHISELKILTDLDLCYNTIQDRKFYRHQVINLLRVDFILFA